MRVINPNYKGPVVVFAEANAAQVQNYLSNNADLAEIGFDKIRADFPGVEDPITGMAPMEDGTIAEIFKVLGYEVTE